jgi:hypothetical protein
MWEHVTPSESEIPPVQRLDNPVMARIEAELSILSQYIVNHLTARSQVADRLAERL